jgi:tetratricopeptide (TPR) repeat protein
VSRDPDALPALTELEARTANADERRELLDRIVERLAGSGTYLSRLADACEAAGDSERAVQLRQAALEADPDSILELHGLERAQRALGDLTGVADTLLRHAGCTSLPEHKMESLLQAAQIVRDQLGDAPRAAAIFLDMIAADPLDDEAYQQGRALLEQTGDLAMLDRLVGLRIGGTEDQATKHTLLLELADVRLRNNDHQGTKVALGLALELAPNDLPTRRHLAQLHRDDGEWPEAIDNLMEAARLARDPETGIAIFYALGELYMDHSDRKDLAEKSFVKVLGWDRSHFAAMERLADLYAELGNWTRSAQALERLVTLATDPEVKVRKMVALASALETKLDRARDAESLLNEARRTNPGAIGPVEALAAMYARQRDSMALNVLLDQSLAQQSLAAATDPDDAATYGNIMIILTMKADDDIASLAAAAIREVGGTPPVRGDLNPNPPEAKWEVGGRVGDPALEDFLSPKEVPAGLRGTLRAMEEPVARMLGATVKQIGLAKDARLDRKHPLFQAVTRLLPAFGMRQEPLFYVSPGNELRIAPGAPPAVMVPKSALEGDDDRVVNFVATASLVLTRSGLALATLLPEDRLRRTVAGLVRLCVPSAAPPPGIKPEELEQEIAALKQVVPEKVLAQIQPLAFDSNAALEHPNLRDNVLTIGHRAGFIAAGSLTAAFAGLRSFTGATTTGLAGLPGADRLVAFVFSKDHLELRQRMGL